MHPDYRERLLNFIARLNQACADMDDAMATQETEDLRELAGSVRDELLLLRERIEGKLRAE